MIALFIPVHKEPQLLFQFVNCFDNHYHFYIHVDANYDINKFYFKKDNVRFLEKRIACPWGRLDIVRATLAGLDAIFEKQVNYSHIYIMGDQAYPLKPLTFITDFFKMNEGNSFFYYNNASQEKTRVRYEKFHCKNRLTGFLLNRLLSKRTFPAGYDPFWGSPWIVLATAHARYLVDFLKKQNKFYSFFKYVHAPNELIYHTVLLNSEFKNNIINKDLLFTSFRSNKSHPRILTKQHFNILPFDDNYKLFARKFNLSVDADVIEMINHHIQQDTDR